MSLVLHWSLSGCESLNITFSCFTGVAGETRKTSETQVDGIKAGGITEPFPVPSASHAVQSKQLI